MCKLERRPSIFNVFTLIKEIEENQCGVVARVSDEDSGNLGLDLVGHGNLPEG